MNILKPALVIVLAVSTALSACNKGEDSAVLARVNRSTITAADFKRQLEDLQPQMQQAVASDPKARKEFLDDLVGIEVVLQEARRQGLDKEAEFKKRQEMLRKELERRIEDDAKNELFNNLLKKELADKLKTIPEPTEKELRSYYTANQEKMYRPDGKKFSFKEVEPQLKRRMVAEKQRDLYLDYAKALKAKAKITVDEKALDAAAASFSQSPDQEGRELQRPPADAGAGNTK